MSAKMDNGWIRYPWCWHYVARGAWETGGLKWAYEKRLGLVSYWLIRWIHGDEKLKEMARAVNYPSSQTDGDSHDSE